jgi:capsular exopolysaccharide synthesis family protein
VLVELADLVSVLRRRWWMVALALAICTLGSGVFSLLQPKVYSSSVKLLVPTGDVANVQSRAQALDAATSYAQFAGTGPAIATAIAASNTRQIPVSVSALTDGISPFFEVTAESTDPAVAQRVAASYASVLPQVIMTLEKTPTAEPPQFTVLEPAQLPSKPTAPRPIRNMLIGAALGLVLGVAVALLREALDGRVRDGVELERAADVALLGLVPKEFRSVPVPARNRPRSRRAEAYRAVRTNLEFLSVKGMPRSIVVTSAFSGEGKSSLTVNLGIVASRAGRDVVIVDADLRKPTIGKYLGLDSPIGLTDILLGRWSLDEALQQVSGERLWVLSSGPVPAAPGELVGSMTMAALIEELEHRFDFVIVDTPPVLAVSDGLSLAVNVDGVVLITRMRETTKRAVQRAAEAIRKVNATLVGVVGNVAVASGEDAIYGYGDGYRTRAKLDNAEAFDIVDEIQPLEAAGRRPRIRQPEEAPRTRRERRRGEESRGSFDDQVNIAGAFPPSGPETAPRGVGGLFDVDLRASGTAARFADDAVASDPFALRPRLRGLPPDDAAMS